MLAGFRYRFYSKSINQEILETIRQHVIPMLLNQSQQHNIVTVIFMLFIASESGSCKERKKEKN